LKSVYVTTSSICRWLGNKKQNP